MSEDEKADSGSTVPKNTSPEMRRGVSRRSLITDELGKAGKDLVRNLPSIAPFAPGLAPFLKLAFRETPTQRAERMLDNLWMLLMGREPKKEESAAGLEVIRAAKTPDERGDALVDILWALCQTREFEELARPDRVLVRGLYKIALDRDPTESERYAALEVLSEATEPASRVAALEGLFTGLVRSMESILRKDAHGR